MCLILSLIYLFLHIYVKIINNQVIFENVFDKNDTILFEDVSFIADRCSTKFHVVEKSCNKGPVSTVD